jgi:C-terminal processing protease CtpA/Prc
VVETPPCWIGVSTKKAKNGGAAISSLVRNGPAAKAGLKVGDVITQVNGTSATDQDFEAEIARYRSGSSLRISYMRDFWDIETTVTVAVAGS